MGRILETTYRWIMKAYPEALKYKDFYKYSKNRISEMNENPVFFTADFL
jgi:hypothetical protein